MVSAESGEAEGALEYGQVGLPEGGSGELVDVQQHSVLEH